MNVVPPHATRLVREVMATEPIVVRADAALDDAARLFHAHDISGIPVVDAAGCVVGVVSESDLLRARATDYLWASWETLRVRQLMTAPALTIRSDEPLTSAARRMDRRRVSRLVVVAGDDDLRPIGVIAISDVLRAMTDVTGDAPGGDAPRPASTPSRVPDLDPDAPEERGD